MPVTTQRSTTTVKERGAVSTRHFYEALGLGVVAAKNLPYLTIALTEATTDEIKHNVLLRERIKSLYQELLPPPKTAAARAGGTTRQGAGRTSTGTGRGSSLAPGSAPDLDAIARNFPSSEWSKQLNKYTKESLKKAVAIVQERHPGTEPTSMATKPPMISYLLAYMPRAS